MAVMVERVLVLCAPKFKVEDIELVGFYRPDLPLVPLDGDPEDSFGDSVALDGNLALVGAHLDHVGVVHPQGEPRLVEEHAYELRIRSQVRQDPLECDRALEPRDAAGPV